MNSRKRRPYFLGDVVGEGLGVAGELVGRDAARVGAERVARDGRRVGIGQEDLRELRDHAVLALPRGDDGVHVGDELLHQGAGGGGVLGLGGRGERQGGEGGPLGQDGAAGEGNGHHWSS
jgi:hypothetical protein